MTAAPTAENYAHSDPEFPDDVTRWEPLFSEDCEALEGPGHHCEKCESLDRFHGHLNKVAWWAGKFAGEMFPPGSEEEKSAREWGYPAGLWHDLGKFAPEWQVYLRGKADPHVAEIRKRKTPHRGEALKRKFFCYRCGCVTTRIRGLNFKLCLDSGLTVHHSSGSSKG